MQLTEHSAFMEPSKNVPIPIIRVSRAGIIIGFNRQAILDFGGQPEDLANKPVSKFIKDSTPDSLHKLFFQTAKAALQFQKEILSEKIKLPEVEISDKFGKQRIIQIRPSLIGKRESEEFEIIAVDITEEVEKREYAEALSKAKSAVHEHLELPKVLDAISQELKQFVPYDTASLMFFTNNELSDAYYWRSHESNTVQADNLDDLRGRLKNTQNIQRMLSTKETIYIPDTTIPTSGYQKTEYSQNVMSYIGIPVIINDKVIGILNLNSKALHFTDKDVKSAQDFANIIGQAIDNAHLHEAAQSAARLDSLTGLLNHGQFIIEGQRAIKFSEREDNRPFGVVMMDLDNFKDVNDTRGHQIGDNVLVGIAQALAAHIRFPGVTGRYGGEEFGVVIPLNGLHKNWLQLNRISDYIRYLKFPSPRGTFSITASIGIANADPLIPENHVEEYLDRADTALYVVKKAEDRNGIGIHMSRTEDTDKVIVFKPAADNSTRVAFYDVLRTGNNQENNPTESRKNTLVAEYYFTQDKKQITLRKKLSEGKFSTVIINIEKEAYLPNNYSWSDEEMQIMRIIHPPRNWKEL
ncbi:diguanylate cyclase [Candidatus Gottesmanbacteria bacterium]|nr:diguanylate cyclase [Candidatus Gottesmanbacteria bacterium]